MTLSSTVSRVSYAGNGVTTAFSFPYYFLSTSDLVVILTASDGTQTTKTLTTHYTVTGAGVQAGGTVTMITAPASGETLVIYRDPAQTQDLDLVENDPMPAEELEKRLDKLTMEVQRLSDRLSRTVTLTDGYAGSFSPLLPGTIPTSSYLRTSGDGLTWTLVTLTQGTFDATSPMTTKGDLITYGTTGTRLPVGANGSVLTADSNQSLGIKWDSINFMATIPNWNEDIDSPIPSIENNQRVYLFGSGLAQKLYCTVQVPNSYIAGCRIRLFVPLYTPDTSGTNLINSTAYLIRDGVDAMTSTTNSQASGNSAATVPSIANTPTALSLSITNTSGQINGVGVTSGDIIKIFIMRGTDTATSDIRVIPGAAQITFN